MEPVTLKTDKLHTADVEQAWLGEAAKTTRVVALPQATPAAKPLAKKVHVLSQAGKPLLALPKLGVFALYFILDKLGIRGECLSYAYSKQEMEVNQQESEKTRQAYLVEMKKAIEEKEETERWGIAVQVFSWIGSLVSIITGAVLIATGVGAIGGSLLIAGGVLTLVNQLMETFGAWKKIVKLLPGDDPEAKRAVVTWMQIGITVLTVLLAGSGIVFGGFASIGESMGTAMNMMGATAAIGSGVGTIGVGVHDFLLRRSLAESERRKADLAKYRYRREDLTERAEGVTDRLETLFNSLATNLGLLSEINQVHQQAWR